jgi:hypothetical protein
MAMNRKLAIEYSQEVKSPVTTSLTILLMGCGSTQLEQRLSRVEAEDYCKVKRSRFI